jgi:hypothetical protein
MSIGGIMDFQWVAERQVYCGSHCTIQGALQVIGETAVAMFTLSIALHTFTSIWLGRRLSYRPKFWISYSICVWLYVLLFALIGWATHIESNPDEGFFAPTSFCMGVHGLLCVSADYTLGCWIKSRYANQRFGEYIW